MDPATFSQASDDLVDNCRTVFRCGVDDYTDLCTPQCVLVNDFAGKFGLLLFGICLFRGLEFRYANHPGLIYKYRILIVLPVLALAYLWQEVLAFGEQQKLGLALIAFAIAIGTHYFAFNQTTFRR